MAALQEKKDKDSNWLLYGYEEAMRHNSSSHETGMMHSEFDNASLSMTSGSHAADSMDGTSSYDKNDRNGASSDKSFKTGSSTTLRTGTNALNKNGVVSSDDSSSKSDDDKKSTKPFFLQSGSFKPFFSTLNSSGEKKPYNVFDNSSSLSQNSALQKTPFSQNSEASSTNADTDPLTLETPGLTAAKSDPLMDPDMNSPMDTLPEESSIHSAAQQDPLTSTSLPTAASSDFQLNQQKNAMTAPAPLSASSSAPVVISPLLLTPEDTAASTFKPSPTGPAPVRPRVADPRDFLNY
ncbi:MAG TPA: hypothetical protein VGC39_02305 [Candidatus Methylacidiphilales bacterium]